MHRFYSERKNITLGSKVKLPDDSIKHIKNVLRLEPHDKIIVFNGIKEYSAELTQVKDDFVQVKIIDEIRESKDDKVKITVFQSLLKSGNVDKLIKSLTEIGVDMIIPLETEFSQVKANRVESKIDRWQKIAIAACKQCERIDIPEVLKPIKFNQIKDVYKEFDTVYFFTIPRNKIPSSLKTQKLTKPSDSKQNIALLIGPEGGFSPAEHQLAQDLGFEFVEINDNILRSETASVAAASIIRFLYS